MAKIKTNAMRLLEQHKITYQILNYQTKEALDGVLVASKIGRNPEEVFKTLVTRGQSKEIYVFVLPVAKELDLKKAAKVVKEKKIELISVNEINQVTGYIRGGCSPIGMKKIYQTVIDESGKNLSSFILSGGKIGLQLELCPIDLTSLIPVRFADVTSEEG